MWLLHVEDDEAVQRSMGRCFRAVAGLEVAGARNQVMALDTYGSRRPLAPLAVIVDFDLGKGEPDGAAVVAALRRAGLVSPCAFFTSTPEHHVRERLAAECVTEPIPLWSKPDDTHAVVAWVSALAKSR